MQNRTILISGAGIAGPALAHFLLRYGFQPTLIEAAPAFREGGYMVDFWGLGYEVAGRMGLLPRLSALGYRIDEVAFVDRRGRRRSGFDAGALRRALKDRFFSLQRVDLARAIFDTVADKVETIFGDTVETIAEAGDRLAVTFRHAAPRHFDLVVGTDGLHSQLRRIAFGPEENFLRYLGYWTASFIAPSYPHRDQHAYLIHGAPGRQLSRYALRQGRSAFFFVFQEGAAQPPQGVEARKAHLAGRFAGDGWEAPEILAALEKADELYFDTVSQIRMPRWSSGRVVLLGDAAWCPSLLAGEGSGFALAGAWILAGELARAGGDHRRAFPAYEKRLRDFITAKQDSARAFAHAFCPRTRLGLATRDAVLNLAAIPLVAGLLMRRFVIDRFTLPDYGGGREIPAPPC
jgi:2-polyprenyl-6-methoxyphenol hydroxylase-like FAD-dependent oxidoreductase